MNDPSVGCAVAGFAASPIAIIGMGCRFPGGADDPERFWELLLSGRDAVCEVPTERWDIRRFFDPEPGRLGKTHVREAGFLQQSIYQFDPLPFGVSPREAEAMDPQQRLLLETAWESMEDAGQDFARLRGSLTGVFIGGFMLDTLVIGLNPFNHKLIDQQTASSATMAMLANRLSYVFDLRGPSLSLDSACSSSLVALHYACQSLLSGDCDMALAGGVNVMLIPEVFLALSHARMTSPLGRCMAFDENASGYARGEGCGILVLKTLERAVADGDAIRAVIHATGVNQDGRTSGITLPNPEAQAGLMREVYRRAKIRPGQVAYVEAHGTGTQAGDKAELEALGSVMAEGRCAGDSCVVGAVKSNIGHLEAAAGVAGLIKAVLVLEHRQVPPNLHLQVPNSGIHWEDSCLRLPESVIPLTSLSGCDGLPYAAVNSFGYGGTNAHVLLRAATPLKGLNWVASQDATPAVSCAAEADGPWLLPVSACDAKALQAMAGVYAKLLQADHPLLVDIVHSAAMRRTHLLHRLVVVADNRAALAEGLTNFAAGIELNGGVLWQNVAQMRKQGPVFVYTGMGPQWWGMGRELSRREPVFRQALEEVDKLVFAQAGWSLLDALGIDQASSLVAETRVAQPANLALQVALTRLLEQWGIVPSAVVGHSIGEVAAAWSCGALSLPDAVTVALQRSEYQQTLARTGGGMLAVDMTVEGASNLLREYPGVAIAAINAPSSLTFSGSLSDLAAIASELDRYEVFHRLLHVEIPYHSSAMEAIREPLLAKLSNISPLSPQLPWYSTVHGGLQSSPCDAQYWWMNVREPVRFQAAVERMIGDGFQGFLEVGPHPVLHSSLREILIHHAGCWSGTTLHRKQPESRGMFTVAADLHVRGYPLHWSAIMPGGHPIRLPTYPWQRQHYWKESRRSKESKLGRPGATWLWASLAAPFPAWEVDINRNFFPWLNDHRVGGRIVFPGAAYVAAALAIQSQIYGDETCAIEDVTFSEMLSIDTSRPLSLVSTLDREAGIFRIYSHAGEDEDGAWRLHAEGRFRLGTLPAEVTIDLDALRLRCSQILDPDEYYRDLARLGFDYGPAFRRIAGLRVGQGEVLLELSDDQKPVLSDPFPPCLLDATFQAFSLLAPPGYQKKRGLVPVSISGLRLFAPLLGLLFARLVLRRLSVHEAEADMFLVNETGRILATAMGVRCRAVSRSRQLLHADWFHELEWHKQPPSPLLAQVNRGWLLLGTGALLTAMVESLEREGLICQSRPLPSGDDLVAMREALYVSCQALQSALPPGGRARVLIFFDDNEKSVPSYNKAWRQSLLALALAQAAGQMIDAGGPIPVLCFITRMSQSLVGEAFTRNPDGAVVWGLARVISNESSDLVCRMVDMGDDPVKVEAELLRKHLSGVDIVDEIAFRKREVYQLQLIRSAATRLNTPPALADFTRHEPLILDAWQPGSDYPIWREASLPKPALDEVLVEVDSWLLAVGGLVPLASVAGLEWRGRVRSSNGSVDMSDGQRVWGVSPGSGTSLTVSTCMVLGRDAIWPLGNSEGFPETVLPLLQAWHGLAVQGRLKKGETVLLHSSSNPISFAWAEVACRLGVRLLVGITKAETRSIWEERLQREAVIDATNLDYREQLQLKGEGVIDVVVILNEAGAPNLVSPLADASVIAKGGRLLLIGDTLPEGISGRLLTAGVQILPYDLESLTSSTAAVTEAVEWLHRELAMGWRPQCVFPSYPLSEISTALADAGSGRFVRLDFNTTEIIKALPAEHTYFGLQRRASYLITGGTSGFGLALAEWLADQGVSHLLLVSRRGHVERADQYRLDRIRRVCRVTLAAVDVTNEAAVYALFVQLAQDELPLRGVFHCAMVLSDAWLRDIDTQVLNKVLKPKVAGAMNLHRETRDLKLDCFVLFSSVSALVGTPGQGAYAAANACLDSIAHWRRGLGLPALSMNLGPIDDVGVASRDDGMLDRMRQSGMGSLDSTEALAALGNLLLNGTTQAGVVDIDWARWNEFALIWPVRFHSLAMTDIANRVRAGDDLRSELIQLEPDARLDALTRHLRFQLAQILRQREEMIEVTQALSQLGLDSLMALEWVITIHQELGMNVSAFELLNAPSLAELSGKLLSRMMQ
ncbi:MAG: SDR family NAD(P)-dependent oxidoreductase [Gammaproteobacteria bacterium]|nr:SDR family NAD(P)-dependent oxidoreductase [Gammaproteobacteria bacterium]